jgi:hypothetical protein
LLTCTLVFLGGCKLTAPYILYRSKNQEIKQGILRKY